MFLDTSRDGQIPEKREYRFTDWDPSATSDPALGVRQERRWQVDGG